MFNKLKKVFGYRDNQHTISVREMNTKGLDISEPIYTMIRKIKDDPKRLKFSIKYEKYTMEYSVRDIITGTEASLYCTTSGPSSPALTITGLSLTYDEEKYILQELGDIYTRREERYRELTHIRAQREIDKRDKINREKMLKLWEEE